MIRRTSWRIAAGLALIAVLGATAAVRAQNATTGTLGGVVRDAQLGVLPGASVVVVHAPTGTRYEAFTRADGRFDLLNAQVGPYDLEITLSGFGTQALSGVVVTLGEATEVPVTLQLATVTETVEVTAEASSVFSPSRYGTTAGVESGVIETLPTIERSLQDFARTNPFFVKTSRNADSESFLSVAGGSGRYNNIQIDGAVNNDLFGLAAQGTPGGQANTQAIVRQSGFSGGGINVITRSGSNRFSGTAYLYSRNQGLVGRGIDDVPIATFFDRQQGASVGGPLVRNRAFFANVDTQRRETPVGYSLDGSSGVDFGRLAEGQRIVDVARTRYGYDIPGGFGEIIRGNPNDKIFVRSDLNLCPRTGCRCGTTTSAPPPTSARSRTSATASPTTSTGSGAGPTRRSPSSTARSAPPSTWPGSASSGFATAGDPAGAGRLRPVPRPHAVRLAVQPVLQHRERVPSDPGVLRPGQPDSVLGRPRRPAHRHRLGVDQRDQPRRPRLPLPAAPARQPRLRPRPRLLRPGRQRRAALLEDRPRHIDYRNLNLVASGAAPDGRPTHSRLHRDFSNVILLTNTDQGSS